MLSGFTCTYAVSMQRVGRTEKKHDLLRGILTLSISITRHSRCGFRPVCTLSPQTRLSRRTVALCLALWEERAGMKRAQEEAGASGAEHELSGPEGKRARTEVRARDTRRQKHHCSVSIAMILPVGGKMTIDRTISAWYGWHVVALAQVPADSW